MDLLIGLVTYPGTRFPESSADTGLSRQLAAALEQRGHRVNVSIHDTNVWSPTLLRIDENQIKASVTAELDVEARWRAFLSGRPSPARRSALMAARKVYRKRKFLPRGIAINDQHPGVRMVRRLVNIESAHLSLLRQASQAGCDWALIVEDDATADAQHTAELIDALITGTSQGPNQQPLYVNVSRSFSESELGLNGHLRDIGGLPMNQDQTRIMESDRPITNTVCAVLYRGTFLPDLVRVLSQIPLSPVIPIDWKLNEALMQLSAQGNIGAGDCWTLSPAPIIQASMHRP